MERSLHAYSSFLVDRMFPFSFEEPVPSEARAVSKQNTRLCWCPNSKVHPLSPVASVSHWTSSRAPCKLADPGNIMPTMPWQHFCCCSLCLNATDRHYYNPRALVNFSQQFRYFALRACSDANIGAFRFRAQAALYKKNWWCFVIRVGWISEFWYVCLSIWIDSWWKYRCSWIQVSLLTRCSLLIKRI